MVLNASFNLLFKYMLASFSVHVYEYLSSYRSLDVSCSAMFVFLAIVLLCLVVRTSSQDHYQCEYHYMLNIC